MEIPFYRHFRPRDRYTLDEGDHFERLFATLFTRIASMSQYKSKLRISLTLIQEIDRFIQNTGRQLLKLKNV